MKITQAKKISYSQDHNDNDDNHDDDESLIKMFHIINFI